VPVLFENYFGLGYCAAYTPNMVNLLTLRNYHLVIPMPFGPVDGGVDEFEYYMFDQLYWFGLTLNFIDDWECYHLWLGEVHCGTNARRLPSTTHRWWHQQ
jgi:protein-arginine deiminase